MNSFSWRQIPLLITLMYFMYPGTVEAQQAVPMEKGPVHEAFVSPTNVIPLIQAVAGEPPQAINESVPEQCDEEAIWLPGYWAFEPSVDDFIWISGVWRVPPPDHSWIPGDWKRFSSGWVWLRGFWSATEADSLFKIAKRPPDALEETPPAKPGDDSFWVSGYWHYDLPAQDYQWLSGAWETLDPNWVYVPAHYVWREGGYIFIPAYWDRPLEQRGCAYAPITIAPEYRETIIYEPWVIIEPAFIIEWYFTCYPDYWMLFWHHHHFHPGFWDQWCCVPPWWSWDSCWCFNGVNNWALWWWWSHPGFPQPFWMNLALSNQIPPPSQQLLGMFDHMAPPPNVMPWGVVKPGEYIDGIREITGSEDPIMPADQGKQEQIRNTFKPRDAAQERPLLPGGNREDLKKPVPRPSIEMESPSKGENGGRVRLPPTPPAGKAPQVPMPKVPSSPPSLKPPAGKAPHVPMPKIPAIPPSLKPPATPPAFTPPRPPQRPQKPTYRPQPLPNRNPPSYLPPSYRPPAYKPKPRATPPSPGRDGTIYKPSETAPSTTTRWRWHQPKTEPDSGKYAPSERAMPQNGQRIHRLERRFQEEMRQDRTDQDRGYY